MHKKMLILINKIKSSFEEGDKQIKEYITNGKYYDDEECFIDPNYVKGNYFNQTEDKACMCINRNDNTCKHKLSMLLNLLEYQDEYDYLCGKITFEIRIYHNNNTSRVNLFQYVHDNYDKKLFETIKSYKIYISFTCTLCDTTLEHGMLPSIEDIYKDMTLRLIEICNLLEDYYKCI